MKPKITAFGDASLAQEMPFHGERMTCCVCGAEEESAGKNSDWRALTIDNSKTVYACPKEFPADGSSTEAFQAAYMKIFQKVLAK